VALDAVVQGLSDKPVSHVINTGGQDHRWLGNGYWRAQGAEIIASQAAVADQAARASLQLTVLRELVGAGLEGTEPVQADVAFADLHVLDLPGRRIEIRHVAGAHTPGDSFVWLPETSTVFTGDIVYIGRLLGIMSFSDSAGWLEAFAAMEALEPVHVVPGHGPLTTLERARAESRDYVAHMRDVMAAHIEEGGDIIGAVEVDQSGFAHLDQFEALSGRNAQTLFEQMEWE
jgi:glyoxylase-like metal-dependent hydrolase (beta-lactamase superfamily II)